jgi:hypothetical protein
MNTTTETFTVLWWNGDIGRVHSPTAGYVEITRNDLIECFYLVEDEKVDGILDNETMQFRVRPIGRRSHECCCDNEDCHIAICTRPVIHRVITKKGHMNFCGHCLLWQKRQGRI